MNKGNLTGAEEPNRSAHTPGPWKAEAERNGLQAIVVATATKKIVARISTRETFGVGDEEMADARLIAAAPRLFAEVEELYTELADFRASWPGRHTIQGQAKLCRLRELIADVTGRDAQDVQDDYGTRGEVRRSQS